MPDIIHLLPDAVANQIAAGEVIQRPASAVKELMENSIDADSLNVHLIIRDAGKSLIQVIDDGKGMSETDARMCFEKHATSKIQAIDELFTIQTNGFRGEALASLAAISMVELQTRLHDQDIGTQLIIEGSTFKTQEPIACTIGTKISIKNLFFNVPARRQFLKSDSVETRHILDEFQRIAIANPEIQFKLTSNDFEVFNLKTENLRQRIVSLFGKKYNERLVPIEENTQVANFGGFIGKPEFAKKVRGEQFIFVNQRFIKSPYLNHAIYSSFKDLIPQSTYPLFVVMIDIDPARIDINVHPTKQEIKFEDEKIIYTFLQAAIKHALSQYSVTPTLDFDQEVSFNTHENFGQSNSVLPKERKYDPNFHPDQLHQTNLKNWERLFKGVVQTEGTESTIDTPFIQSAEEQSSQVIANDETEKPVSQLHKQFIITQVRSGILLINQQLAHERILFEKYGNIIKYRKPMSQQTLFPQRLELSPTDSVLLGEIVDDINALGFDIQKFGEHEFVIHGIPAEITAGNEKQMIEELIDQFKANQPEWKMDKKVQVVKNLARQTSIKPGDALTKLEMNNLIDQLFACEEPYKAPNGKATFVILDFQKLDTLFDKKS